MTCAWCDEGAAPFDPVLNVMVHPVCLNDWWLSCGPLPAPVTITSATGRTVTIGSGSAVEAWNTEDEAGHLRRRGVLT